MPKATAKRAALGILTLSERVAIHALRIGADAQVLGLHAYSVPDWAPAPVAAPLAL